MFWRSTCRRKANGIASIDWRTVSSAALAPEPSAFCSSDLATSRPPPPPPAVGVVSANSMITCSCSSAETFRIRAISIETCSTCFESSLRQQRCWRLPAGRLIKQHGGIVDVGHGAAIRVAS